MSRSLRLAMMSFMVGCLMAAGVGAAYADSSASGTTSHFGKYAGYSYTDYNEIIITTHATAATFVDEDGTANVPAGYEGYQARLFTSDGSLCKQTSISYNSSSTNGWGGGTQAPSCGVGSYYSDGWTYVWNGSSYYQHNTTRSPNLNLS